MRMLIRRMNAGGLLILGLWGLIGCSRGTSPGSPSAVATGSSEEVAQVLFPSGPQSFTSEGAAMEAFVGYLEGHEGGKIELRVKGKPVASGDAQGSDVVISEHGVEMKKPRSEIAANLRVAFDKKLLRDCGINVKTIGVALEGWAADHQGTYPESLTALVPQGLMSLPTCPTTGEESYSSTYKVTSGPAGFEVGCSLGHSRLGAPPGYPRYKSGAGFLNKP